jgi:ketosteroid isomerase-like protein
MKTETNAPDPALVKAAAHSCQLFDEVYNNNDPEALANLFTEDAVLVTDQGIFHGRAEILEFEISIFKDCHFSDHKGGADLASIHPIGTSSGQLAHGVRKLRSKVLPLSQCQDTGRRLS